MNRSYLLEKISQAISTGLTIKNIKNVPELKKYLISKYGYAPKNLSKLDALESVACLLGVPNTKCLIQFSEPIDKNKKNYKLKTRLDYQEIKQLRKEGFSLRQIGSAAKISYERVRQICKNFTT